MQGDKPHTSCVGSLSLVRQGSIPKAHFFFLSQAGTEILHAGDCLSGSLCHQEVLLVH